MLTVERLRRVEMWTNWVAAGGTRTGFIPDLFVVLALTNIEGTPRLTITVPLASPSASRLVKRHVVRIDQDDTPTFDEWKIVDVADDREGGTRTAT